MQFEYPLLEALAAVIREGTFEAAARSLNITQSAVSQRVKLLEEKTGAILIVRGRPCVPTQYGQLLYRHVEQVQLLEHDLQHSLTVIGTDTVGAPAVIRIAVNRDSLATWFPEVVRRAGTEMKVNFDIIPDDQEHTAERLRNGEALAAVTTESEPLPGCRRVPLGAMEYIAVTSPEFFAVSFPDGITKEALSRSTVLVFDRKDLLPQQWTIGAFREPISSPQHWLPSFSGYMTGLLSGAGWGMNPRFSVREHLESGRLVELLPGTSVIVPLYWQSTAPRSELMRVLSSMVVKVARETLLPIAQN